MTTHRVQNCNEYSTIPQNNRVVSVVEIEAESPSDALNQAAELAAKWNREETRENMMVNILVCQGWVRGA